MSLGNVRIVLVDPIDPGNVGAAARAMKNMGLTELVLVTRERPEAARVRTMAVHAWDIVEAMRVTESLEEALEDCGKVVGTTARNAGYRGVARTPREMAAEIVAAAGKNRVALVFGREDHGLANQEIRHCHEMMRIPASESYPCLNLAQAVLLCCYELALAVESTGPEPALLQGRGRELALVRDVERMFDSLRESLLAIGFLSRENPEHLMFAIRRMLGRRELEDQEVRILLGIARQISWAAKMASAGRQRG